MKLIKSHSVSIIIPVCVERGRDDVIEWFIDSFQHFNVRHPSFTHNLTRSICGAASKRNGVCEYLPEDEREGVDTIQFIHSLILHTVLSTQKHVCTQPPLLLFTQHIVLAVGEREEGDRHGGREFGESELGGRDGEESVGVDIQ